MLSSHSGAGAPAVCSEAAADTHQGVEAGSGRFAAARSTLRACRPCVRAHREPRATRRAPNSHSAAIPGGRLSRPSCAAQNVDVCTTRTSQARSASRRGACRRARESQEDGGRHVARRHMHGAWSCAAQHSKSLPIRRMWPFCAYCNLLQRESARPLCEAVGDLLAGRSMPAFPLPSRHETHRPRAWQPPTSELRASVLRTQQKRALRPPGDPGSPTQSPGGAEPFLATRHRQTSVAGSSTLGSGPRRPCPRPAWAAECAHLKGQRSVNDFFPEL